MAILSAVLVGLAVRSIIATLILITTVAVIVVICREDRPGDPKDGPWY